MGQVLVDWPAVDKERFIDVITREMQEHAKLHGAHFVPNPRSTMMGGGRIMTTHPLGGVPMGDDADKGAVDDRGRVFDGHGAVHKGLFVADGSMIPRSLGVTPLLTISALSERIAEKMLAEQPWR